MVASPGRSGEAEAGTAAPYFAHTAHRAGAFDRIIVPIGSEDDISMRAVEAAARIASTKATIVLVYVLEVPRELPLDALFPDEEREARAVLHRATAVVEGYGVRTAERLERAHSAAQAALELAEEYEADMIVLAASIRTRRGHSTFGQTVTAILHRARCRVMLVRIAE